MNTMPSGLQAVPSKGPPMVGTTAPAPPSSSTPASGVKAVPSYKPPINKHDSSVAAIARDAQSGPYPTKVGAGTVNGIVR